jgi:hypothetical protein
MPFTTIHQASSRENAAQMSDLKRLANVESVTYMNVLKKLCAALWIAQAMLAAFLLFAGGIQLVLPVAEMTKPTHSNALPILIGIAQSLSAMGLTLPGLLQSSIRLTPLLTFGLAIVLVVPSGAELTNEDSPRES